MVCKKIAGLILLVTARVTATARRRTAKGVKITATGSAYNQQVTGVMAVAVSVAVGQIKEGLPRTAKRVAVIVLVFLVVYVRYCQVTGNPWQSLPYTITDMPAKRHVCRVVAVAIFLFLVPILDPRQAHIYCLSYINYHLHTDISSAILKQ